MSKNERTILVTGGAGFIGSHLIEALLEQEGNKVISLDNYFIGTKENHIEGAEYREGHTKDVAILVPESVDYIYHLGEYSRVEQSFADVSLVWDMNVRGSFAVFEFWRQQQCKLVYAGSSTKFADGGMGRDQSPYAWMKASNTELVRNYHEWFSLPYAITYFYNAFGPRELSEGPYASVLGRFKTLYRQGDPITLVAPGTQKRNFTYVKDIVRGLLAVGERGHGDEYGLGSNETHTMKEIAEMFHHPIEMLPERPGNRMDTKVDTSRVRNEFDWKTTLEVGDYVAALTRGEIDS